MYDIHENLRIAPALTGGSKSVVALVKPQFGVVLIPLVAAVLIGLIGRMGEKGTVEAITAGAADFLGAALGCARARVGGHLPALRGPTTEKRQSRVIEKDQPAQQIA